MTVSSGQSAVAIGNFDGVHIGHRAVLAEARALQPESELVVVTFWPHPLQLLTPADPPKLLGTLDERLALLKAAGADRVEVVEFTPALAKESPEQFIAEVLLPLRPVRVVVGENFRFGAQAVGDVNTLRVFGQAAGFATTALPLVSSKGEETTSSRIRQLLEAGEVSAAAELLGRPFRFSGEVVHGEHRGKSLGFPTANLLVPEELASPADGVYAGLAQIGQKGLPAAISVGSNPTFEAVSRRIEAHVIGRDDLELYGQVISVDFTARLRDMVRFASKEELINQLRNDAVAARAALAQSSLL
ncbi:MAG: bifunctional riboflavin kinase/FAD synthetase [Propionibacteriaceae bacterium]|jgi:riboflavin kinase/FMN adenylyltransferase|nr:bifunctional riboflavin kinase/FAD synthetase [Propionibacteriaceae bacterium]